MINRMCSAVLAAGFLAAAPVQAQTTGGFSDLPETFRIDAGGFHIDAKTTLRYSLGGQPGEEIDFEGEAGLPDNANTFWLDGTWRVGRRHQLSLNYTRSSRTGDGTTLTRDITWGDQEFTAGLTVQSESSANLLSGYYRFAAFRNDRFEIGPAIGIGYLSISATLRATGSVSGGPSGTISRTGETSSPTGDIGGYFVGWLGRRVALRGDFLYLIIKPEDWEASISDSRIGLYWYPWRNVGFGAQYKYYKYRYERSLASSELGGNVTFQGVQFYASFVF